ncbi:hypothetical protein H0H93_004634 [Arthromyces matolae]|nr:hypothetical protein H0H93_004634 [Arthromyces matolae]
MNNIVANCLWKEMNIEDSRDFGKGRQNDSSSSPESSPRQTKKRSFSPTSDDDDLEIPPIADDDTPPPPERPIIRQAVAFAWPGGSTSVTAPTLNTYEMVLPVTIRPPTAALFLPGQNPIERTNSFHQVNHIERPPRKKKKMKNDYGGQTGRFRLIAAPEVTAGNTAIPEGPEPDNEGAFSVAPSAPLVPPHAGNNIPLALRQVSSTQTIPTPTSSNQPTPQMQPTAVSTTRSDSSQAAANVSDSASSPKKSDGRRNYYRRDYEQNNAANASYSSLGSASNHDRTRSSGAYDHARATTKTNGHYQEDKNRDGRRPQKTPLSMLTLLIQDIRSGVVDHQLAEVKVPMKQANDPTDGFWADAKQLLLPPGQLPQPPKIPRELLARTPSPDSTSESVSLEGDFRQSPFPEGRSYEHIVKELEMYRRRQEVQLSPSPEPNRGRKSRKGKQRQGSTIEHRSRTSSAGVVPSSFIPEGARFESPHFDDPPERVDRLVTEAVDEILQEDEEWTIFFRAKAALEPQRAMDVLKQYKFVKRMVDALVGKSLPFKSFKAKIEPKHIAQALKIEDPRFASDCEETLGLLDLYGEEGSHYPDPRVIAMVKDSSIPEYNAKPIKRLLHLMRDIDKKWKEEHSTL